MKKIMLLLLMFIPCLCKAQFELTPTGFIATDSKKDFIVKEFGGKSSIDLYEQVHRAAVTYSLIDVNKGLSNKMGNIEGEVLTIIGKGTIPIKRVITFNYTLQYSMIVRFKDGRIRFDAPTIMDLYTYNGYHQKQTVGLSGSGISSAGSTIYIFRNDGEVREKKIKETLEDFFNNIIDKISNSISGADDDW